MSEFDALFSIQIDSKANPFPPTFSPQHEPTVNKMNKKNWAILETIRMLLFENYVFRYKFE